MPTPEEIAEAIRVVQATLGRVREMKAAADKAAGDSERDSVLLLYKAGVKVSEIPPLVGLSYSRVHEVVRASGIERRNNYPGRPRQRSG